MVHELGVAVRRAASDGWGAVMTRFAIGVCGFGRCGSTMAMSMLIAGGVAPGGDPAPPYEGDPDALYGRDLSGVVHERSGRCRPDLAVEAALSAGRIDAAARLAVEVPTP